MDKFFISERYRLEIHWSIVKYEKDGVAVIDGCYFSGAAVKEIGVCNESDVIDLEKLDNYHLINSNLAQIHLLGCLIPYSVIVFNNAFTNFISEAVKFLAISQHSDNVLSMSTNFVVRNSLITT